jgi:hypothetical protein
MFRSADRITINFIASVLFLMAITPPLAPFMQEIESRLLPVVSDVKIIDLQEDDGGVSFRTSFDKVRGCKYVGLTWSRTLPGGLKEKVAIDFPRSPTDESDSTRPTGEQITGRWWLAMSLEDFKNSTAWVRHECHILYESVTQFYP